MLKRLRIPLSGQHHLGMDDVTNLSKILKIIVSQGGRIEPTGSANNLAGLAATAARQGPKLPKGGKMGGKGKSDFGKGDAKGKSAFGKGDPKGKSDFGKGDFKSKGKGKRDSGKGNKHFSK